MRTGQIITSINSELATTLNILAWINDLKTFGNRSYVFLDPNKLLSLSTNENAVRDPIANQFLLDTVISSGGHVGKFFATTIPSDNPVFDTLKTIDEVAANNTAVNIIANSSRAMTAVANSFQALKGIASTTVPANLGYIESSSIAKEALYNSPLKQHIIAPITYNVWTNRRSGKIWLISQFHSRAGTEFAANVRYTINGNSQLSQLLPPNVILRHDRFMTGITNHTNTSGLILDVTYWFIPCE